MLLKSLSVATLQELYQRGVKDVLLFISDGLTGMTDAIHRVYPKAKHQVCCVHVARNIAKKVRVKDRSEILSDFKACLSCHRQKRSPTSVRTVSKQMGKDISTCH
ncbi:transposase [Virgibacillus pantothenticus]|nr:transposase [Virgibacillus pantothenticus]MBU8646704.1 transposase [Virgibacillus pantothenticus]MBU8664413.1 transposase [Virgibacillus pantothenticus]MBU8704808.1 transposase [Virgibacillus pantothenticus]